MKQEHSAGGLVLKKTRQGFKILMVEAANLEGKIVYTFPKGHLEKRETALAAAQREIWEETGWLVKLWPRQNSSTKARTKIFQEVRYTFFRGKTKVLKRVTWFLMAADKRTGRRDPEEIRRVFWMQLRNAKKKASYPLEKELLQKLLTKLNKSAITK